MEAIVWTRPGELRAEEREEPRAPEGNVILEVTGVGICGTDVSILDGGHSLATPGTVLGHEFAGIIRELGPNVKDVHVGDLVAVDPNLTCGECTTCRAGSRGLCRDRQVIGIQTDGGLQTRIMVGAGQLIPLAAGTDPVAAALVEPLAVGIHAAHQAGITSPMSVAVIGGGPIGVAAARSAQAVGAEVTIIEPDPARQAAIEHVGLNAVRQTEAVDAWDAVVDAVGNNATIATALRGAHTGATIAVVGLGNGDDLPPVETLVRREINLTGSFCYTSADLRFAAALVAQHGKDILPLEIVVGLDQAVTVLAAQAAGQRGIGKTILVPAV